MKDMTVGIRPRRMADLRRKACHRSWSMVATCSVMRGSRSSTRGDGGASTAAACGAGIRSAILPVFTTSRAELTPGPAVSAPGARLAQRTDPPERRSGKIWRSGPADRLAPCRAPFQHPANCAASPSPRRPPAPPAWSAPSAPPPRTST
ncbi:hypothetical protein ACFFX0_23745 [Citricoccus parietis]|uniref:Uncharacterized protein n=1 Tax=Citricoccus parietis TaxID=592307 RepID=A0ABV5G525_9MICC